MVTQNCHLFLDINECELYPNLCKGGGLCVNTQGSFRCNCPPGLILDSSGTQCVGKCVMEGDCVSTLRALSGVTVPQALFSTPRAHSVLVSVYVSFKNYKSYFIIVMK